MYQTSVISMLIFAHRGASGVEPENTLRAIQAALDAEVDGIEIDIHEVDNKLVVIHDRWLHRTTSGQGQIYHHNFSHIRSLDAGNGETIPTLDEVLALVAGKCTLNIELKGIQNIALLFSYLDTAIDSAINAERNTARNTTRLSSENLLLSSFNHRQLNNIKQSRPEFAIGALTACYPLEYAKFAERLNAFSVHLNVDFISKHFVEDAHARGLKVFVYTVDELEDINTMKSFGVDGIFSNFPARAKNYLEQLS